MTTRSNYVRKSLRSGRIAAVLMGLAVLVGGGCTQRIFRPSELPSELLAPPLENIKMADLSRLEQFSVSSQQIEPGDLLDVSIVGNYGDLDHTPRAIRVGENGMVVVPLVGPVYVAGMELDAAEVAIGRAAVERAIFLKPNVTVGMNLQRMNRVKVVGDGVEEPGVYELPRGSSTLLAALTTAKILTAEASPEIEISRPARTGDLANPHQGVVRQAIGPDGTQLASFNQIPPSKAETVRVNLTEPPQTSDGYYVGDGDVVVVTKMRRRPIHVFGKVASPGQYDLPTTHDLHLLDALALAGGRESQLADRVSVVRRLPDQEDQVTIQVSVRAAKGSRVDNILLAEGDVISVEETALTLTLDTMRNFFRFSVGSSLALF